ncbi:hypothetical protein IJH02_01375, partial [Candidatus Saccharibacteria bacterium]|nr:hypothetical protein [Candidatus Saccharibacteria bacterium]
MRTLGVLAVVFAVMIFGLNFGLSAQATENETGAEPTYLEFFMDTAEEPTITLLTKDDAANAKIEARQANSGSAILRTGLLVTTSNPTGYTVYAEPTEKDANGEVTNMLVRGSLGIGTLKHSTVISRDGEDWDMTDFPSNSWGIGIESSGLSQVFRPMKISGTEIKTTDLATAGDEMTVLIGVKVDRGTKSGEYSNTLKFTAVANPIPYVFTLEYDANGGTPLENSEETVTVFNEDSHVFRVTNAIPTRSAHATGEYVFLGWSEDQNATTAEIAPTSTVTLATDDSSTQETRTVTEAIYAVWQKNYNYALEFDAGTEDEVRNLPETQEAVSTDDVRFIIPENVPTRVGYDFDCYTDGVTDYMPGETYAMTTEDGDTNPITRTLRAKWVPKYYMITIINSLTSTNGNTSVLVPYDGSAAISVTPNTGHYLSEVDCPEGYSCTKVNGAPVDIGSDAVDTQVIKITNNKVAGGGTLSFAADLKSYEVAITPSANAVISTNSLSIPYGGSMSFTVTPNTGYYLSEVSCSEGYTCSGYTVGVGANGKQVITVTNNLFANNGAVGLSFSNIYTVSISNS